MCIWSKWYVYIKYVTRVAMARSAGWLRRLAPSAHPIGSLRRFAPSARFAGSLHRLAPSARSVRSLRRLAPPARCCWLAPTTHSVGSIRWLAPMAPYDCHNLREGRALALARRVGLSQRRRSKHAYPLRRGNWACNFTPRCSTYLGQSNQRVPGGAWGRASLIFQTNSFQTAGINIYLT